MQRIRSIANALFVVALLFVTGATMAQVPQPDGGGVQRGVLPRTWNTSGPTCPRRPEFQVHAYNDDLYILRESGCSNYEKPFVFLLFGTEKALLLDTGAGPTDIADVVTAQITQWLRRHHRDSIDLVVAHTHAHGDHTAGDDKLKLLAHTIVVPPTVQGVQSFFGIQDWPNRASTYDLGKRILDVIPIPGHEASSIAIYDRTTGVLFTGDTLYPGRLYVRDAAEYTRSIQRLVDFTAGKVVTHIIGNHIEQTHTPYLDYPIGTIHQPDEHALELGRSQLLELNEALKGMTDSIRRAAYRDFTVWPHEN